MNSPLTSIFTIDQIVSTITFTSSGGFDRSGPGPVRRLRSIRSIGISSTP